MGKNRQKKGSKKTDSTLSLLDKKRTKSWLATFFSTSPKQQPLLHDQVNPGFFSSTASIVELDEIKNKSPQKIHGSQYKSLDKDAILTEISQLESERDNLQAEVRAMKDKLQTQADHIIDLNKSAQSMQQQFEQEVNKSANLLEQLRQEQHANAMLVEENKTTQQQNATLRRSKGKLLCKNNRLRHDNKNMRAFANEKVVIINKNTKCIMVGNNNKFVSRRSTTTSRSSAVSGQTKRHATQEPVPQLPLPQIPDSTANWVDHAHDSTLTTQAELHTMELEQVDEFRQSTNIRDHFGRPCQLTEDKLTSKPNLGQLHKALADWKERRTQGHRILHPEQLPRSVMYVVQYLQSLGGNTLVDLFDMWKITIEDIPTELHGASHIAILSYGLQLWLIRQIADTTATAPHLELNKILKKL